MERHLQFAFFDLGDGIVAGAGSKRHVGEGGIYARGGDHAGAVWEEKIFGVVGLVVGVEDGSLGIAAHASGAHFMDGESGRRDFRPDGNVLCASSGENFGGLDSDVAIHGMLVFAPGAVDFQGGNAPGVELLLVDFDVVVVAGET